MKRYKINTLERTNKGLRARYRGSFDTYQEALKEKDNNLKNNRFAVSVSITDMETLSVNYFYKEG